MRQLHVERSMKLVVMTIGIGDCVLFWRNVEQRGQQFYFEFDADPTCDATSAVELASVPEDAYGSLKRVSLVYEGSLRERPCLTSTIEAKAFFKRYWNDHPANDQEKLVVACLDTKHRVQCVVLVTVGTLDASLVWRAPQKLIHEL